MLRKTNIFYLTGQDSKFLTFSNYTECLTGNFLSTNHKMFPTKFICLNLQKDDNNQITPEFKNEIIQLLISKYENKLAFLRDKLIESNQLPENYLCPLAYLLETLKTAGWINNSIPFIGDITEQDYNGTYSDIMCIINMSSYSTWKTINNTNNDNTNSVIYDYTDNDQSYLYGWTHNEFSSIYNVNPEDEQATENIINANPVYDDETENIYNINSSLSKLTTEDETTDDLTFNVIIPLFSIIDITKSTINTNVTNEIDLSYNDINSNPYNVDVPLGIWIADDPITLKRDSDSQYFPIWSLVISTQFKPFPYNSSINNLGMINNNLIGYHTFAEILGNQQLLLDKYIELNNQVIEINNKLNTEIQNIQEKLDSITYVTLNDNGNIVYSNTTYDTDIAKNQLVKLIDKLNNKYDALHKEVTQALNDLKWHQS